MRRPLARHCGDRHSECMILLVYIPSWQLDAHDIAVPVLGQPFKRVLTLTTNNGNPAEDYGCFGQETTLTGTAIALDEHRGGPMGNFPTEFRSSGVSFYWLAPARVSGEMTVTGIIGADSYCNEPSGFPSVTGIVTSMAAVSLQYATEPTHGRAGHLAPGSPQILHPLGTYRIENTDFRTEESTGLHRIGLRRTGLLIDLDTAASPAITKPPQEPAESPDQATAVRVRLFPDHPGTVLWFFGRLDYANTGLSAELITDLTAWEASYYSSLTPDMDWKRPEVAAAFTASGNLLARRLVEEIGPGFAVEFYSYERGPGRKLFSTDSPANNPVAASAFQAIVTAEEAEQTRFQEFAPELFTYSSSYEPLPKTIFRPFPHEH